MPSAGRVGRPHGLDGHFHVTSPTPPLLSVGTPVRIGDVDTEIVARKGTEDAPILRVAAASDRSAAVALRGEELVVERADAPVLDEDEYWAEDLVGCRVIAGERVLGSVVRLLALPSCEALEVQRPGEGDLLVPLVGDAVRAVDVSRSRIDIDLAFVEGA